MEQAIAEGRLEEAIATLQSLVGEHTASGQWAELSWDNRKLAQCSFMQGQLSEALEFSSRAIEAAGRAGNILEEADAENALGIVHGEKGELAQSVHHLERSYQLHVKAGSNRAATVLNNIGNACLIMDDPERALGYFHKAQETAAGDDSFGDLEGTALSNIGRALNALGRHGEAMDVLRKSVEFFARRNMETLRVHSLAKLAATHESLGELEQAEVLFRKALASADERNDSAWVYELHGSLGALLHKQGRYDEAEPELKCAIAGAEKPGGSFDVSGWRQRYSDTLAARGNIRDALSHLQQAYKDLEYAAEQRTRRQLFQAMGRLEIERIEHEKETYRQRTEELSATLEQAEALRGRLEERNAALAEMAVRDPLTGVFNRRWFIERLGQEIARSRRYNHPLAVAILDLDWFKHVNDTYGHLTGDRVLVEFAGLLRQSTRSSDDVARYGGEEFAIVMPETTTEQALRACEKLRDGISNHDWAPTGLEEHLTFSAGVATLQPEETLEMLVERADRRLYLAKAAGRNVTIADDTGAP